MNKVAVYGSLRKGLHNHGILLGSKMIGQEWIPCYDMFSLGSFPGIREGNGAIFVEVYEVDAKTIERLDVLEGFRTKGHPSNFYEKENIETKFGDAIIYTLESERYRSQPIVSSGNWKAHSANLTELI